MKKLAGFFWAMILALFCLKAAAQNLQPQKTSLEFRKNLRFILEQPVCTEGGAIWTRQDEQAWVLLLEKVPWAWNVYQSIPAQFSLAKQDILWSPEQIIIENPWLDGTAQPRQKSSRVLFSFDDVGSSFNSQLEIPLLYSVGALRWKKVPPGYYVFRLRAGEPWQEKRFNLRFETRF